MQADPYSTARAAQTGIEVQKYSNGAHFIGTADALIAGDLLEAERLPTGKKRVSSWRDEFGNVLNLVRIKGGRMRLSVHFCFHYAQWVNKLQMVDRWIDALPSDEETYRRYLRSSFDWLVESFVSRATRPHGGYFLDAADHELVAAFEPLVEAVIERLPIKYSARDRAQQIRRYRSEAEILEPGYMQFRDALLGVRTGP